MKQVQAARKMIRSLQIEPEHAALKEMVLGLAAAVEKDSDNGVLWREYRAAVSALREATSNSNDDETQTFQFSVKTPRVRPEMGNS